MKVAARPERPLVIYDGDCNFCMYWAERCRRAGGEKMDYAASQQVAAEHPDIPAAEFERSVQVIEPDGTLHNGADAILRIIRDAPGWRWLVKLAYAVPPLLALLRWGYWHVARNRMFFSRLTRWFWGTDPAPSSFAFARRLFAQGLGLTFFFAFTSILVQAKGLFGPQGIWPTGEIMMQFSAQVAAGQAYAWQAPTLFWVGSGSAAWMALSMAGVVLSVVLMLGCMPGLCALLLWALYLSICTVGGPFMSFQWDALLLETALISAVFLPWQWRPQWRLTTRLTTLGRWLLWWLIFRLMFESGVVKLASGDPAWRDLTAMSYHYETQPLPLWTAWVAHQAPMWVHKLTALATFAIEFLAPFGIFLPRRLRHLAAYAMIALQIGIASTGNYTFFNFLTALLCLPMLDDAHWPARWRRKLLRRVRAPLHLGGFSWSSMVVEPLGGVAFFLTAVMFINVFQVGFRWPAPVRALFMATEPLKSFNSYGLFAVMTKERREIVVEGSRDGVNWEAYEFHWKPGSIWERPQLAAPHQPRLDWQFWFAALAPVERSPWVPVFLQRLLEGSPDVLDLLKWNPFWQKPPQHIRAVIYDYHFTRFGDGPAWWRRELLGVYHPSSSLKPPEQRRPEADGK